MIKKNFLLLVLLPIIVFGKSYFYPQIKTDVYFTPDGNARVVQERTYSFDGAFSWAFVNIKKQGADDIIFNQLSEKSGENWIVLEPEIETNPQSLSIRWQYTAQNEEKTFKLDYTILDAVRRFSDVGEFYWKIIEEEHEPIGKNVIRLILPESSSELFKVYIHSRARPGLLEFNDTKDIAFIEQSNIPKNTFVEVRMLASPNIFSAVHQRAEKKYEKILSEERQNFVVSMVKKLILIPIGLLLIIVCPLILLIIFYRRYGREPQIPYLGTYEHEPPRKAPPITIPAILHQKPGKTTINQETFRGMFATLLDLCTKGMVSIQENKDNSKNKYQFLLEKPERVKDMDPINQRIVKFLFEEVSKGELTLTDKDLKDYAKKYAVNFQSILQNFFKTAQNWWKTTLVLN